MTAPRKTLCIFGDMNQQGTLNAQGQEGCASSQNGRGGTFYVLNNAPLFASLTALLQGAAAPVKSDLRTTMVNIDCQPARTLPGLPQ